MGYRFSCSHCGADIAVRFLGRGEEAKCPACGNLTPVPEDAAEVEPEAALVIRDTVISVPSFGRVSDAAGTEEGFSTERLTRPFTAIKNERHALFLIADCARGFVIIGGIGAVLFTLFYRQIPWDGIIYVALGVVLLRWHLRWAAIVLLVLSAVNLALFVWLRLVVADPPPGNPIVMALLLWGAIRAVEAIHKLRTGSLPTQEGVVET